MSDQPGFTPGQAEQATRPQRSAPAPVGAALPPGAALGGAPADVDVSELRAHLNEQMRAMQEQIDQLRAGQAPDGDHPLIGAALSARDQLGIHFAHNPHPLSGEVLRLAEDVIDAARNAVDSGDAAVIRALGGKLERAMGRAEPAPGENHYFRQAREFAAYHLPGAADTLQPVGKPARPAQVVAGSVTG